MQNLLLLHGAIGSKEQFKPLAKALEPDFYTHTLNFSGHGGEAMPDFFSIELFATNVLNYLESKQIECINVFGYSMGGYVALFLAKHHPEKMNKIFTLATKFAWTPEIAQKEIKMLNSEKIMEKIPSFAKTLEQRHYPNDWKTLLDKTKKMMMTMGDKNPLTLHDYESIQNKTILSIGDDDSMVTLSETKDVCQNLKNGQLFIFPETEHPIEKVDITLLSEELKLFFGA